MERRVIVRSCFGITLALSAMTGTALSLGQHMAFIGGAVLFTLLLKRILAGPQPPKPLSSTVFTLFAMPAFVPVAALIALQPELARVAATGFAASAALAWAAQPMHLPFATLAFKPRIQTLLAFHSDAALCSLMTCWLLVILAWTQ
jgi:hypothetical protein